MQEPNRSTTSYVSASLVLILDRRYELKTEADKNEINYDPSQLKDIELQRLNKLKLQPVPANRKCCQRKENKVTEPEFVKDEEEALIKVASLNRRADVQVHL